MLAKLLLNSQLIQIFGGVGAILGTTLAAGIAVILNIWRLKEAIHFNFKQTNKRTLLIIIFTIVMSIVVLGLKWIFGIFLPYGEERWAAAVMLFIGAGSGALVYLVLVYASTLLERIFDGKIPLIGRSLNR